MYASFALGDTLRPSLTFSPCESTGTGITCPPAPRGNDLQAHWQNGGGPFTTKAEWVVGCDGGHSIVREQASIPFEGGAYEENFILGGVQMDWPIDREEVTLFYSENGLVVAAPLPDDHFPIVATVHEGAPKPSLADFETVLGELGPKDGDIAIRHLAWSSRFRLQHRVAKMLRQGKILLAGDAAHVHSPAGGQGMNTGIQDAISLANALHQTIEANDEHFLDEWQEERLKVAHSVVELTDRMRRVATVSSPALKLLRNTVVELIDHISFATHLAAETLAELRNQNRFRTLVVDSYK